MKRDYITPDFSLDLPLAQYIICTSGLIEEEEYPGEEKEIEW